MAEFRKLPTQEELQQMLFMQGIQPRTTQDILQQNLAPQTIKPIPENVFKKIAGGAKIAGDYVNRAGTAADVARLFPGYTGQSQISIPTGFSFAPKQAPTGEVLPQGLQTQQINVDQLLKAIKPADVLGISSAERAYGDIGMGKAPQPMDVVDVAGLGALGLAGTKAAVKGIQATKGLPVGMSIQDVSKAGGLLQEAPRSPLGFYSALEETALNLQRNKGAGQAFLNDLQKGANVKAEEIKWIGLDDFLKNKPNVTKQEVQDYIANNRVDVQEVKSTIPRLPGEGMAGDEGAFLPKFGQYTLPGGENYREILLTMPANMSEYNKYTKALREKYGEGGFANLPLTDIERARLDKFYAAEDIDPYKSTHFPQENILAHLRVNDRVDADGKKMLLIEEVQSDWHQAGREKGYALRDASQRVAELNRQYSNIDDEIAALNRRMADVPDSEMDSFISMRDQRDQLYAQRSDIARQISDFENSKLGTVPDAPFKDSWYQLALKRAIQHAAENGYDRIGLTTGSQQAARFDLSKQVDKLQYEPSTKTLDAYKDGNLILSKVVEQSELPSTIGKDAAKKLLETSPTSGRKSSKHEISGIDLQFGGEGMKKYYDEIYPKFLDKYGKKWGAKVAEGKLQGTASKDELTAKVYGMGETYNNLPSELKRKIDQMYIRSGETIRYIDITPEMKASVSKGQPMFQVGIGATGGLLGAQEERK